jgi:hypothetical protein
MSGICNVDVKLSPGFGNGRTFEIWNTLVYLLGATASAMELSVGLFLLIIVGLLLR